MAVREKYGPEFFARIGSKGGRTVREKRGPEFYANIGRLGGQTTRDRSVSSTTSALAGWAVCARVGANGMRRRRASRSRYSSQ
jgi:general stress protein YciG